MRVPTIRKLMLFTDETSGDNATATDRRQWMLVKGRDDPHELFFYVDSVCNAWFAFEVVVRFASSPNRMSFIRSPLNLLDVIATLSFYADMLLSYLGGDR
jgi:potassium voltage-gated channel Shaw-related subfamily C protein